MPTSNQAKKRVRQNEKRRLENRSRKSSMKTYVKKVVKALDEGDVETAKKALPMAMKKIDKAAKRNVIHKKQAARRIGRLSRRVDNLANQKPSDSDSAE